MATHPRSASSGNNTPSTPTSARVDVWLQNMRQIESRSAATSAYRAGRVRIGGETAKSARHVSVGDEVRYRIDGFNQLLTVIRIPAKRAGVPIACTAYVNPSPPLPPLLDAPVAVIRDRGAERPTKKERRQPNALMGGGRHQNDHV